MADRRDLEAAIEAEGGVTPCQNAPDMFFETDEIGYNPYLYARQLCAECPVQAVCLEYALDAREPFGVWGGTTPGERRRMLRRVA